MSKVLIIEDEEAIADLEKDYLELSGFSVEIENDGIAGLKRALTEDFEKIEYTKSTRHSGECFLHIRRIPAF